MNVEILVAGIGILSVVTLVLAFIILLQITRIKKEQLNRERPVLENLERIERAFREESGQNRKEQSSIAQSGREELGLSLNAGLDTISKQSELFREGIQGTLTGLGDSIKDQMVILSQSNTKIMEEQGAKVELLSKSTTEALNNIRTQVEEKLTAFQQSLVEESKGNRKELNDTLSNFSQSMHKELGLLTDSLANRFESFSNQIQLLTKANEDKMESIRQVVDGRLTIMQEDNNKKLDEMRKTVDEKLHATLEARLGESFKLVGDRLDAVHKGLGEMQVLATGVGDLKKVLTNVKTRGIMGEILLSNLLDQILTPEQYEKNVCIKPGSAERVEFAVKFPGQEGSHGPVWLSIDSKFPQEDYQRLQDAYESGNPELIESHLRQLETRIKVEAKAIRDKYINPPDTCDFAIMFLPTEGLFAEILRRPGLHDHLHRELKVIACGPTTLAAILNSLQMGFRTLAIAKRSSEVWSTLGVVKAEFGKFGTILEKTRKKLEEATNTIDDAARKSRTIEKKLRGVEAVQPVNGSFLEEESMEDATALIPRLPEKPEAA